MSRTTALYERKVSCEMFSALLVCIILLFVVMSFYFI